MGEVSITPEPRIGDADRDRAVELLREHYSAGRLNSEEFDERMSKALLAKTASDLRPLFSDLPSDPASQINFGNSGYPAAFQANPYQANPYQSASSQPPSDSFGYPVVMDGGTPAVPRRRSQAERMFDLVTGIGTPVLVFGLIFLGMWRFWWLWLVIFMVLPAIRSQIARWRSEDRPDELPPGR